MQTHEAAISPTLAVHACSVHAWLAIHAVNYVVNTAFVPYEFGLA